MYKYIIQLKTDSGEWIEHKEFYSLDKAKQYFIEAGLNKTSARISKKLIKNAFTYLTGI